MQRVGNHVIFDIDDTPVKVMVCHRCLYEDDVKVDIEGCGICFRCGCGGWNTDLQGVEPTKIDFRNLLLEAWRLQAENNRLREEIDPLFMDVEIPTFEQAKSRMEVGIVTPLDKFIYSQEPAGEQGEMFRDELKSLVVYILRGMGKK